MRRGESSQPPSGESCGYGMQVHACSWTVWFLAFLIWVCECGVLDPVCMEGTCLGWLCWPEGVMGSGTSLFLGGVHIKRLVDFDHSRCYNDESRNGTLDMSTST